MGPATSKQSAWRGLLISKSHLEGQFAKFYPNGITTGKSLSDIYDDMCDAGFTTETHVLLSWCSTVDLEAFMRGYHQRNQLIDRKAPYLRELLHNGDNILQAVDLRCIIGAFLKLPCYQLGYVFRALTGRTFIAHRADNNVRATIEVLRILLEKTYRWFPELYRDVEIWV
jgi:hypothetical protein